MRIPFVGTKRPRWMPKGWGGSFIQATWWAVCLALGYGVGVASGPTGHVLGFAMGVAMIGALVFTFLGGIAVGLASSPQTERIAAIVKDARRVKRHPRTPACVQGSKAPCREAICDCGCHCGRHGLVVGGAGGAIVPAGASASPPLLDRCSSCDDCTGWSQS